MKSLAYRGRTLQRMDSGDLSLPLRRLTLAPNVGVAATLGADMRVIACGGTVWAPLLIPSSAGFSALTWLARGPARGRPCTKGSGWIVDPLQVQVCVLSIIRELEVSALVFGSPVRLGYWVLGGSNRDRDRLASLRKPEKTGPDQYEPVLVG